MDSELNINNQVWSASYAGVEVFQLLYNGTAVMRRRKDSYINVTQILKCAQYDKPRRTRFLEREIHTGIHEKVQGGYGKYQGTWVPLDRAVALAQQLNIYNELKCLFEFNPAPGEKPPTAPRSLESMNKRKSVGSTKPRQPGPAAKRRFSSESPQLQHRAGSLATILNSSGIENVPHPVSARPSIAGASPISSSASQYRQQCQSQPPPPTPSSRSTNGNIGNSWDPAMCTPTSAQSLGTGHYASHPYLTPETPESGMRIIQCGHNGMSERHPLHPTTRQGYTPTDKQAAARRLPLPMPTTDNNKIGLLSPTSGRVLRDISNTYQGAHDAGQHAQQQLKKPQRISRPSSSLLTPPSSIIRRPMQMTADSRTQRYYHHYHQQQQTSHIETPTANSTLSPWRPPLPNGRISNSNSGKPLSVSSSRHLSTTHMWTEPLPADDLGIPAFELPLVTQQQRLSSSPSDSEILNCGATNQVAYSAASTHAPNSAAESVHSRTESTVTNRCDGSLDSSPVSFLTDHVKFIEFISRPRSSQQLPGYIEDFMQTDTSFTPNSTLSLDCNTYLHMAVMNAHWDVVQILVARGADTTKANREGKTALMFAANSIHAWNTRSAKIFEWLLDMLSPSLTRRDKRGRTVVHWACIPPPEHQDIWPLASLYYIGQLVQKFGNRKQMEVLSWQDYSGNSSEQLAKTFQLDEVATALSLASQTANATSQQASESNGPGHRSPVLAGSGFSGHLDEAAAISANGRIGNLESRHQGASTQEYRTVGTNANTNALQAEDRYDSVTSKAIEMIRLSTADMRKTHQAEQREVDNDIEYAAHLLLELGNERDVVQLRAQEYYNIEAQRGEAECEECVLKRKIECAIGLQQSARTAAVVMQHMQNAESPDSPSRTQENKRSSDTDMDALRAEYALLKRSIGGYRQKSQNLASEYAQLTAVVKPWARPPTLSLLGMFGEDRDGYEAQHTADGFGAGEGGTSSSSSSSSSVSEIASMGKGGKLRAVRETLVIDSESAEVKAINAVLEAEEQRLQKLERVVSAACGDLTLDKVRTVVGPVLSVLNNGNTL
ncbi:Transcription factor mbp1 [Coemansia spiralis]|uniref:Transcription factor mbp1 n=1 Tax=Coemansia spiralis TaxID=417178 RepID=A0A9W8GBK1_9FUNG|nr:Transcription factor mbp1 [Coemansia spiralis]